LFDEEGFPICAPELLVRHPELSNASPQVLMRFPLLRLASEETIGLKWADWLSDQGVKLPVVTGPVFTTFSLLLLELVAARGIALGYESIVDQLFIDRRIVRLSDRSVRTGLGFYLVYRDASQIPIETLIQVFRKGLDAQQGMRQGVTGRA
jgi:DNA-binding transcriptional LysR family regulator